MKVIVLPVLWIGVGLWLDKVKGQSNNYVEPDQRLWAWLLFLLEIAIRVD